MWYGNTKTLLEGIVRGLKAEPSQNDAEWQLKPTLFKPALRRWWRCRNLPSIRRMGQPHDMFTVRLRIS
jgi:hypothetical protein